MAVDRCSDNPFRSELLGLNASQLAWLEAMGATASIAFWEYDKQSQYLVGGPGFSELYGFPKSAIWRGNVALVRDRVHPDDLPHFNGVSTSVSRLVPGGQLLLSTHPFRVEAGAEYRWLRVCFRAREGSPLVRGAVLDAKAEVEQERRIRSLQACMQRADQAMTLGMLAGAAVHDLNNLLTVLVQGGELLGDSAIVGADRAETLAQVLSSGAKAAVLLRGLLRISRSAVATELVAPGEVLEQSASLLRSLLHPRLKIALEVEDELPLVRVPREILERAIANLVINAKDATLGSGTIHLSAKSGKGGGSVLIAVRDEGVGMDAVTLEQAFVPFFSTKGASGTGLGLPSVKENVESFGGSVHVISEVGKGSTFTLEVPATMLSTAPHSRPSTVPQSVLRRRLLIIEEDSALADMLERSLRALGFQTARAQAAYGVDFLAHFQGMPDAAVISGESTVAYQELRTCCAWLPIVCLSSGQEWSCDDPHLVFLPKPCTAREVYEAIDYATKGRRFECF